MAINCIQSAPHRSSILIINLNYNSVRDADWIKNDRISAISNFDTRIITYLFWAWNRSNWLQSMMCDHRGQIGTNECEIWFHRLVFLSRGVNFKKLAGRRTAITKPLQLHVEWRHSLQHIYFWSGPLESDCRNLYANPFLFYAMFGGNFHGWSNVCVWFRLNLYGTHWALRFYNLLGS